MKSGLLSLLAVLLIAIVARAEPPQAPPLDETVLEKVCYCSEACVCGCNIGGLCDCKTYINGKLINQEPPQAPPVEEFAEDDLTYVSAKQTRSDKVMRPMQAPSVPVTVHAADCTPQAPPVDEQSAPTVYYSMPVQSAPVYYQPSVYSQYQTPMYSQPSYQYYQPAMNSGRFSYRGSSSCSGGS